MIPIKILPIFLIFIKLNLASEDIWYNENLAEIDPNILEDSLLSVADLIQKYKYPAEIHHVETADGYILEMHRIPSGGKPILLMHGLLDSSSTWVMMGPNKGFAYMLSDMGYDVWMGNARGNTYSKNHTTLNPKKGNFWKFSFHEIGKYDLPAMIDYVLKVASVQKLHYIGHSQGTTAFWIMCSENPRYANKILSMQALAPVAYLNNCRSALVNSITFIMNLMPNLISMIGPDEFLPNSEFLWMISEMFCKDGSMAQDICSNIIFLISGFNEKQMNKTMLPVIIGHTPAGAATKQIIHFSQLRRSGIFRQYDYGVAKNLLTYGSMKPPNYDLSKVKVKVALHYSQNDWLAHPKDVENLHVRLPNVIGKFLVNDTEFNHLDFVWGIDVRSLLYKRVVQLIELVDSGDL